MIASGFKPRGHILNCLMDFYCKSSNIAYALHLFNKIPEPDIVARTTLIAAYFSVGNLKLAQEVFGGTPLSTQDTVFYNAMITTYSHNNDGHATIEFFRDIRRDDFRPANYTFTSVLGALVLIVEDENYCQQMHYAVLKSGTVFVTLVLNALISAYVKCASSPLALSSLLMGAAKKLFDEMPKKDELTWTTMITGYMRNNNLDAAREVLNGVIENIEVAWNAMISGYVHHGFIHEALEMFRRMHLKGIQHDGFTYTSVINACAYAGLFKHGKQMHAFILKTEEKHEPEFLSVNNALVSLYGKCDKVEEAREIFNKMLIRDLISWNGILFAYANLGRIVEAKSIFKEMPKRNLLTYTVMISGLAQNGFEEEGLKLFNHMRIEGFEPCDYAFAGEITSCAMLGALEHGR